MKNIQTSLNFKKMIQSRPSFSELPECLATDNILQNPAKNLHFEQFTRTQTFIKKKHTN